MENEGHFVAFNTNKGDIEVASLHQVKTKKALHCHYIKLSLHPFSSHLLHFALLYRCLSNGARSGLSCCFLSSDKNAIIKFIYSINFMLKSVIFHARASSDVKGLKKFLYYIYRPRSGLFVEMFSRVFHPWE